MVSDVFIVLSSADRVPHSPFFIRFHPLRSSTVLLNGAAQGKTSVELRAQRWSGSYDIATDSQPVRFQGAVADPHLQVAGKQGRSGRRQPQEIASPTLQLHLGNEEVVICRQV